MVAFLLKGDERSPTAVLPDAAFAMLLSGVAAPWLGLDHHPLMWPIVVPSEDGSSSPAAAGRKSKRRTRPGEALTIGAPSRGSPS
ncbi:hypothetical protein ACMHYB_24580 [Sorangium sp. So ce1128]